MDPYRLEPLDQFVEGNFDRDEHESEHRDRSIPMFTRLEIETQADCNRKCPTCIRTTYPNRDRISSWYTPAQLPTKVIHQMIDELATIAEFSGDVNLQHYNEPLLDPRIEDLGLYVRSRGFQCHICTNADLVTPERAPRLNKAFDAMDVALYMPRNQQVLREQTILTLLPDVDIHFNRGRHVVTHFHSDSAVLERCIEANRQMPCPDSHRRLIIDHRGEMLMCCEDVPGHFDLGNIWTSTLEELWFSEKHQRIISDLMVPGGRVRYPHCAICPRPGVKIRRRRKNRRDD